MATLCFNSFTLVANSSFAKESIRRIIHFIRHHHVSLIILISILVRLPFVFVPDFYGFQDASWRQADTASIAHNFVGQENLFFPKINWGGNGPGFVETEFQLYPFIVSLLYQVFGEYIAIGMFVSLVFSAGSLILFYALARSLLSPKAATIALIFFTASPIFIKYSVVFMPEPTVFFFYIAALYLFISWLNRRSLTLLWLAALSTALAILVKPTSIHIGFVFLILLIEKYGLRFLKDRHLWMFAVISLLPGILWYLHARNLYLTYGNTFGIISGGDSKFDNLRYWLSPGFYISLLRIELLNIFSVGGVFPFAFGIVLAWNWHKYRFILYGTFAVVLYYLLLPRYTNFADYYHIYALPYASLGVALGVVWLFDSVRWEIIFQNVFRYKFILGNVFVLLIAISNLIVYVRYVTPYEEHFWRCSQNVVQAVPEDALVIVSTNSVSEDHGVPNNYQEPNIFFYSNRYGWSLPSDWHTPEQVAEYREAGGQYFIIYDQNLLNANPRLQEYLDQNAEQTGPGVDKGCGIYRFEGSE